MHFSTFFCKAQCGNCKNLLCKNFVKSTHLVLDFNVCCFHEIFSSESEFLVFPHCAVTILCIFSWNAKKIQRVFLITNLRTSLDIIEIVYILQKTLGTWICKFLKKRSASKNFFLWNSTFCWDVFHGFWDVSWKDHIFVGWPAATKFKISEALKFFHRYFSQMIASVK